MTGKAWVQRLAIKLASRSEYKPHAHGAVIERGGQILALGVNSIKRKLAKDDIVHDPWRLTLHAEVAALQQLKPGPPADLYVARVCSTSTGLSKPCPYCQRVIRESNIRRVFYTLPDGSWEGMAA